MIPIPIFFKENVKQEGVFTSNFLDKEEFDLVNKIVNWDKPQETTDSIFEIAGRSVFLKSPTRFENRDPYNMQYGGLQIIGAGGDLQTVHQGYKEFESFLINPVDDTNYANDLAHITQLRSIDAKGNLKTFQRPYVPLHGMDEGEAVNRAQYTKLLEEQIIATNTDEFRLNFVVPKLAAEGFFPDLHDENNNNLLFQIYRVPVEARMGHQLLLPEFSKNYLDVINNLKFYSYDLGKLTRTFHSFNLVYLDNHLGNLSIIKNLEETTDCLYATDLGSCYDFSKSDFSSEYKALDVLSLATSLEQYVKLVFPNDSGFTKEKRGEIYGNLIFDSLRGYYLNEIKNGGWNLDDIWKMTLEFIPDVLSTNYDCAIDYIASFNPSVSVVNADRIN